jgi:hypothetical protein
MWDGEENAEQHKPCWREIWHPKPWCPPIFFKKSAEVCYSLRKKFIIIVTKHLTMGTNPVTKGQKRRTTPKAEKSEK